MAEDEQAGHFWEGEGESDRPTAAELLADADAAVRRFAGRRQYGEALAFSTRALELRRACLPPGDERLDLGVLDNMELRADIAEEHLQFGGHETAANYLGELATELQQTQLQGGAGRGALRRRRLQLRARVLAALGIARRKQGNIRGAVRSAEQAASLLLQLGDRSQRLANVLLSLCALHSAKGAHREALQYAELAHRTVEQMQRAAGCAVEGDPLHSPPGHAGGDPGPPRVCGAPEQPPPEPLVDFGDVPAVPPPMGDVPPEQSEDAGAARSRRAQRAARLRDYAADISYSRADYSTGVHLAALTVQCCARQWAARRRVAAARWRRSAAAAGRGPSPPPPQGDVPLTALLALCQHSIAAELEHLRADSPRMMAAYRAASASAAASLGDAHHITQKLRESATAAAAASRHRQRARQRSRLGRRAKTPHRPPLESPDPAGAFDTSDPRLLTGLKLISGTDVEAELSGDESPAAHRAAPRPHSRGEPLRAAAAADRAAALHVVRPRTTDPAMHGGGPPDGRAGMGRLFDKTATRTGRGPLGPPLAALRRRLRSPSPVKKKPAWDAGSGRWRACAFASTVPPQLRGSEDDPLLPLPRAGSRSQRQLQRTFSSGDDGALVRCTAPGARADRQLSAAAAGEVAGAAPAVDAQRPVALPALRARRKQPRPPLQQVGTVPVSNDVDFAHARGELRNVNARKGVTAVTSVVESRTNAVAKAHDRWIREVLSEDFEDAPPADFDDADVAFLTNTFGLSLTKPLGQKTWKRPPRPPLIAEAGITSSFFD
eukprot:TRINITY_DN857_c1_g1_i2.p1 TRINITY_DN857_c1_g1~~TRINITY_DN857_c1_g1_i2.p1  ORF type:complete len:804 (+),score=194.36 TRINITY_DN857_c1_g1_i2:76-2412(+)